MVIYTPIVDFLEIKYQLGVEKLLFSQQQSLMVCKHCCTKPPDSFAVL